jgi:hypothetical protein
MSDDSSSHWFAAAVLILIVVLLGVAGWGLLEAAANNSQEDGSLVAQLERYTGCLADNGANVPQVEGRGDGGFAVVVPGALLDGDVGDLEGAWQACREVEPALFETLLSGAGGIPDIATLCARFGDVSGLGPLDDRLAEICQDLGG